MKERPILFSAPMVRALLAGSKTQTRRVVKWRGVAPGLNLGFSGLEAHRFDPGSSEWWALASRRGDGCWEERCEPTICPYGAAGDRLWVRETWAVSHALDHLKPREVPHGSGLVYYAATENLGGLLKRPSIFMPRWASRITLEVTGVRVERLQAISEADAIVEGVELTGGYEFGKQAMKGWTPLAYPLPIFAYRSLWESINGAGSWDANPWVWVVEFKRAEA